VPQLIRAAAETRVSKRAQSTLRHIFESDIARRIENISQQVTKFNESITSE
jgi:hypothetical protein